MRVAYICADPGVPVVGRKGCSVHVQEVLRAFVRRGASVDLFASRIDGEPPGGLEAIRVHRLTHADAPDVAARERACVRANDALRDQLERQGPFDLVYERYSLWSFAGMQYAKAAAAPRLLEVNAPLIDEQARHRALVHRKAAEVVASRAFASASAIIAVSDEVAARVAEHAGLSVPIHTVPNGVDVRRFRPDTPPCCSAMTDIFTVGFVGTLKPWHGVTTLVRAFETLAKRHGNVRLLVVGAGPGSRDLRNELAARGLPGISVVTGPVESAKVPSLLTSMTAAVAPYTGEAGFYFSPLKVFEYMAAGLPVVASRLGQLARVIEDGVTGLLCPADDPEALAAALERLYHDADLRARLGRAARQRAVREHSWDSVCHRLLDIAGLETTERVMEALG